MALNAVEQVAEQVRRTIFRRWKRKFTGPSRCTKRRGRRRLPAERDAQRMRQQLEEREEQLVTLRREAVQLRKEREEIRGTGGEDAGAN
jgi:hypothetical protein